MKLSYARLFRTAGMALGMALMLTSIARADDPFNPVPEIDPGSMASAMTLLVGGAMMLTGRSRKA